MNTPIQGTAADMIKLAMIHVATALKQAGLQTRMLLQVHDELVIECPDEEVAAVVSLVRQCMESAYALRVPLRVDVEVGPNWRDLTAA